MKRIAIIGGGDLAIQFIHHAKAIGGIKIVGVFDDFLTPQDYVSGVPVFGGINAILELYALDFFDELLIAIGYKHIILRSKLYDELKGEIPFARLIHPHVWVDLTSTIEPGVVIYPGCIIDMHSTIGANSVLNLGCVIAHHSTVGEGCFLSPGVKIAGFVKVASASVLGIGTTVIDNITIASGVRTGAGAVVIDNVTEPGLYVGVPAKFKPPK